MRDLVKIGKKVFPLNRSLTGKDNLKTLRIFKNFCFRLKIRHFHPEKKYMIGKFLTNGVLTMHI